MAVAKKKKKDVSGNPNVVIIVFLIFFILASIGLGLWGYYGMTGQYEFEQKARSAEAKVKGAAAAKDYYTLLYNNIRLAIGDKLDAKDEEFMGVYRDKFNNGDYSSEGNYEAAKKLIDELQTRLGKAENGDYRSNLRKEVTAAEAKIKDLEGKLNRAITDKERMESISKTYTDSQTKFFTEAKDRITQDNTNALNIVKQNNENFLKVVENNRKLNLELAEKAQEMEKVKEVHEETLKRMNREIATLKAERDEEKRLGKGGPAGPGGGVAKAGESFPLILDVGGGKALWDQKVGKIIRVDHELRQVTIDRGSEHGVAVGLTFNIFANNADRAFKLLKGTIEVVKVVDASTSIARITSLYDGRGEEVPLTFTSRSIRETENALREGDLLFNLFWGSRVAVAGYVSVTGEYSSSPYEQKRQMEDFLHLLRRNGMHIDAFVDPVDGTIRGSISGKTRYVILGTSLVGGDKNKGAMPKDEKAMEKEPGDDAPKDAKDGPANGDRNEAIARSTMKLRKDALDRGLIMISGENFGYMVGFRKARSATQFVPSGFNPQIPNAGIVNVEAPRLDGGAMKK